MKDNISKNIKIVAFDCFDTIVHRDCNAEKILYIWARYICTEINFICSPNELYSIRKKCEKDLKYSLNKEELSYKELIRGIYDYINSRKNKKLNVEFNKFLSLSYSIEKKIEFSHIFIDDDSINIIKLYKKQGKKIIIISDFYLGMNFFRELLSKLEILNLIDEIYISSEIGKRKSTGNLYYHIIECLGIEEKDILMIGDNKESDFNIPKKIGLKTIYKPYNSQEKTTSLDQIKNKMVYKIDKSNVFNGYSPILLLFISKLYEELFKNNCKNVLFCSREGQKLKKLFDIYQEILFGDIKIKSHYFYVSRRSTLLPSLNNVKEENFSRIFRQYKSLTLNDFLHTIGFESLEINEIVKNIQCDLQRKVSNPQSDGFLKKFISNPNFISMYDKKLKIQKTLLQKYIEQFGVDICNETLHIVDIGWKGTIQDNLFNVFDQNIKIHGYYFGLFKHSKSNNNIKNGLIFSEEDKSKNFDILSYNYVELERVFAANHGSTLCYKESGGKVKPELSNDIKQIELYNYVEKWQKNMIDSFTEIVEIISKSNMLPTDIEDIIIQSYLRQLCINIPKQYDIYLGFRKKDKENFGNISGKSDKNKKKVISERMERSKFLFVDYSYRILDRYNLKLLYPFAKLYCYIVYMIKLVSIK